MSIGTVNDLTPREQYVASGGQTVFAYPFPIWEEEDLDVYVNGTLQTLTTHYTVDGVGDATGGDVTFVSGLTVNDVVTITRSTPKDRTTDYITNGGLSTQGVNDDFDRLLLMIQEAHHRLDRAVVRVVTDTNAAKEYDLDGATLTNLADGVDDQDAATVAQLQAVVLGDIPDGTLTLAKFTTIADQRLLGNVSGGAAAPAELTQAQVRTFLGQSANGTSLVTAANYAAMRALLDLEVGTDFYSIAATDAAITASVNAAVAGLLDFKGNTDASSNPNYPAASKGDSYIVTVAGKVGGASGKTVEVGDFYFATADNAGGDEAAVGTSWAVLQANLTGITAAGQAMIQAASASAQWDLVKSNAIQSIIIACSDETSALAAGTAKVTFRMPYAFTLTEVPRASLTTAQTSGTTFTVDINESGASILSTKLTIDNGEKTSTTAATAAVVSDSSLASDAEITIDIDAIGDGTAEGLKVTLIGYKT